MGVGAIVDRIFIVIDLSMGLNPPYRSYRSEPREHRIVYVVSYRFTQVLPYKNDTGGFRPWPNSTVADGNPDTLMDWILRVTRS